MLTQMFFMYKMSVEFHIPLYFYNEMHLLIEIIFKLIQQNIVKKTDRAQAA